MKHTYIQPEMELIKLTAEDILDGSPETDDKLDDEIFIDSDGLWA